MLLCVCCSEVDKFDVFGFGAQVYANHRDKSIIEDRLHFFAEECDNLQVYNIKFLLHFLFVVKATFRLAFIKAQKLAITSIPVSDSL